MTILFPAFCPHCGLIFPSRLIGIAPGAVVQDLVLEGNKETCPRCGQWAELPDGRFTIADDTIHVLAASKLSRERLGQLAAILEQVKAGSLTEDEAAEQAPELEPLFTKYGPVMRKALIAFLWFVFTTAVTIAATDRFSHAATPEQVQKIVNTAIQQCINDPGR
jgi:hypothetical protein